MSNMSIHPTKQVLYTSLTGGFDCQLLHGSKRNLQLIYLRQKQLDSLWNLHDKLERELPQSF